MGIVETLELATYDLCFRLRGERPIDPDIDPPIVIVAINDESFNVLNQNLRTWPRADYARLIDAIAAGGPAVIGVDVAWTHAGSDAGGDEVLARSLKRAGPVILAGLMEHQEGVRYKYDRYAAPVETLAEAAAVIGIHSGPLMDGIVGRGRRVEYTVIGDAVNAASRVEEYTKEVLARRIEREGDDGQPDATILISQATYEQVKDRVRVDPDIPPYEARGITEPIRVYRLLGLSESEGETEE